MDYAAFPKVSPPELTKAFGLMCKKMDMLYTNPRQAYMAMNGNRSNGSDIVEFLAFVGRMNLLTPLQLEAGYAEALFEYCDRNKDGRINYAEFCSILRTDDKQHDLFVTREDPYRGEVLTFATRECSNLLTLTSTLNPVLHWRWVACHGTSVLVGSEHGCIPFANDPSTCEHTK